jgi:hypothetical protein
MNGHEPLLCCFVCAEKCHEDHDVYSIGENEFFCDCGSAKCKSTFESEDTYKEHVDQRGKGISKALMVGINYLNLPRSGGQLSGCINDVKNALVMLGKLGFRGG